MTEFVPPQPYVPLRARLKWRRQMRYLAEEARIEEANGDAQAAMICRQTIASIQEWIKDSEHD